MGEAEINTLFFHVAVGENIFPWRQTPTLAALLFLYQQVFGKEIVRQVNGQNKAERTEGSAWKSMLANLNPHNVGQNIHNQAAKRMG